MSDTQATEPRSDTAQVPLVLLTGPSGAGRSTAIRALEDSGFEVIDNLPLGLLHRLLSGQPLKQPLALGIDVRNRDFSPGTLIKTLLMVDDLPHVAAELLYLDCRPEVLRRRYNETRRNHPLGRQEDPTQGIERELTLLEGVRGRASVLIDTSELTPHELRHAVQERFAFPSSQPVGITVQSFSYRRGLPQGADVVLDCRFLQNPHWKEDLRAHTGTEPQVGEYISKDAAFAPFVDGLMAMLELQLTGFIREGRSHLHVAFGCTGGKHRSVFVTETVAESLANRGWQVSIRHRELNRHAMRGPVGAEHGEQTA